jgi:serine phosphatase RsbU (regulator of sigma subunit)
MSTAERSHVWSDETTDRPRRESGPVSRADAVPDPRGTPGAGSTAPVDRRRAAHATTFVVLAIGLILTVVLVVTTSMLHNSNEERLLRQRTREAAAVLTAFAPSIQTPLASSAETVEVTGGTDQQVFERLMAPLLQPGGQYKSASLWRLDGDGVEPVLVIGEAPLLAAQPPDVIRAFLQRAVATKKFALIGLLDGPSPRIGYASTSTQTPPRFVAYAEAALPANRTSVVRRDSAFSGLASAIYLGDTEDPSTLLTASTPHLPLRSPRSSQRVAFGDSSLLLVMSPTTELGGRLMALLPWLVGAIGLLATLGVSALAERLLRRRDQAERLARDNAYLYANQRSVAETLQHSLLPDSLPEIPGVDLAFRYQPGAAGVDIGGDWYDVIPLDGDTLMLVVGDVSGRGVKAGAVMASLRFAIRAFASQGDSPSVILAKLTRLVDLDHDGHFATVLCGIADVTARTVTIANAGHPHALLAFGDDVSRVEGPVGVPIGVSGSAVYESVTVSVPPRATLLAFTDGLFERRGETIDVGLARLRASVAGTERPLEELLTEIVEAQASDVDHDDVAILGVRWTQ